MNRNRSIGSRLARAAVVAVVGMQAWCVQAAPAETVREVVLAWNELATEAMVAFARNPATVLYRFFGRDDIPFAQTSVTSPGITRNFTLHTGRRRERPVAHPRRIPLPPRGDRRASAG